jgi:cytochrome c553
VTRYRSIWIVLFASFFIASSSAEEEEVDTFEQDLARVDDALRTNPTGALKQSLQSCLRQRNFALELWNIGMVSKAERTLEYCFDSLHLPREAPEPEVVNYEEQRAVSEQEYKNTLKLEPDMASGLRLYRDCAACHEPEGWGRTTGSVPQIAGQHRNVVIRQLTDFRAGNRESVLMAPYAASESIGGAQSVADISSYIAALKMSSNVGHGPGNDLESGEQLYKDNCTQCHGESGQGNNDELVPRIQGQHYKYLVRQFARIKDKQRRNADPQMTEQISQFTDAQKQAVLDYTSRLLPPAELRAPEGWKNPDFAEPNSKASN